MIKNGCICKNSSPNNQYYFRSQDQVRYIDLLDLGNKSSTDGTISIKLVFKYSIIVHDFIKSINRRKIIESRVVFTNTEMNDE